jgi:glycosyltransferase involved in cell wall biosynthesis
VKVAVYAIACNEIAHVERFMRSCVGADTVLVADTGSTDGTQDALRRHGADTRSIAIRPWRFDDARNVALALVPADIDVCIALDLDEVLSPGWRAALERSWRPHTTLGRYRYVTSHLADGSAGVEISGAKVHCRFGYRWRHICHEVLVADRLARPCETWLADMQVDHWPDVSKDRSGYLALLEAAVSEAPDDVRDLFLLGREYAFLERWNDAETVLHRYLRAAANRFPQQRATAWRRLARCRAARKDVAGAIEHLQQGLAIAPQMRDLWLDLADLYSANENLKASYDAAQTGLKLSIAPGQIANDPLHCGGRPYHQASLVAARLGLAREAHALAIQADLREPAHPVYSQIVREQ